MNEDSPITLANWQQDFVDQFLSQQHSKSLLVAAPGTGKTITALFAANKMLERGLVDSLLVISDRIVLRDQWRHIANRYGIELENSLENHLGRYGVSATLQSLRTKDAEARVEAAARARRWLIVADDPAYETKSLVSLVDRMLSLNNDSKALFISRNVPQGLSYESEFRFKTEFILERSILEAPATEIRVARYAPSFSLLRQLQKGTTALDSLSWREFEKLIATLLEKDGYTVELMQGSKDGGVDVIAVKDLGANGYFKALWQAKKQALTNKVGISVVRELADTRQEFGASKGIIVTSSYLTSGALNRINRDKYILGKVDREDLDAWIRRTLFSSGYP
ncbi:MAG TPA: restriction endonuclease [Geobacteraceae bacterium]